jgi:hypothetical protein
MTRPALLPLFATDRVPRTVGELEAALQLVLDGSGVMMNSLHAPVPTEKMQPLSEAVESVSVDFRWDMHHERPCKTMADVRQRSLQEFRVQLRSDWEACEARLRERHGAPTTVTTGSLTYLRSGPFFVLPLAGGAFSLTFFERTPDWALPKPDEDDRTGFLRELSRILEHAEGYVEVLAGIRLASPRCGIAARGDSTSGHIELSPAMSAVDLVRLWSWHEAIGQSVDVHMSSWHVRLLSRSSTGLSTHTPVLGKWEVDVRLEGLPSGDPVQSSPAGPFGYRHLGIKDLVRHVSIRPHIRGRPGAGG